MASTIISVAIVVAILWWVGRIIFNLVTPNRHGAVKHCMTCGVDAKAKTVTQGSTLLELVLWLCFIVPGLIYSVWRLSSRHDACSACEARALVPLDAPAAVAHRKALGTIAP